MTEQHDYTQRPKEKCIGCGILRTPGKMRWQHNRAIKRGLTPDEAKALMPRCQKCLTKALGLRSQPLWPKQRARRS
jgi:hypothetical protein